jgi:hypothetical protein
MPIKNYPYNEDYVAILGHNNNGWLQLKVAQLIRSQIGEMKHHVTEIFAKFIHNFIQLEVSPDDRQDTEWYLAEKTLFPEISADQNKIINWITKCIFVKACYLLLQTGEDFPSPGSALIGVNRKRYQVSNRFIHYLHELSNAPVAIVRLLIFATNDRNPIKITLDDAEICLGEELREIFERRKDKISVNYLKQPWGE